MTNPLIIQRGPDLYDELFAIRVELVFQPNEDGSPSVGGQANFHTEWWHFYQGQRIATTQGPVLRIPNERLLARSFNEIPVPELIASIKTAFIELAVEAGEAVGLPPPQPIPETTEGDPQ